MEEDDEKVEAIVLEKPELTKLSIIFEEIKNNLIWILIKYLPLTRKQRLERKWNILNIEWQERYWNLNDKFENLSENDFIKDKEILEKFEALKYIDQFKNCTIELASGKISRIVEIMDLDYIIYNDRITWFTYVLIKDICDFLTLEIDKIEKNDESLKGLEVYNILWETTKLINLFSKLFLLIDPLATYITTRKNEKQYKKLNHRKRYLVQQIKILIQLNKKLVLLHTKRSLEWIR